MQNGTIIMLVVFSCVILCVSTVYSFDAPHWAFGWWEMKETRHISTTVLGQGGYLDLNATTRYDLMGHENVTLENVPNATYLCYRIEYSGPFQASGYINQTDPFPVEAEIRIVRGSIEGFVWLDLYDLRLVKRITRISGLMEVEIYGNWLPLNRLDLDMEEEFDPPLRELYFPMDVGRLWDENVTIYCSIAGSAPQKVHFKCYGTVPQIVSVPIGHYYDDAYQNHVETAAGWIQDSYFYDPAGWYVQKITQNYDITPKYNVTYSKQNVTDYYFDPFGPSSPTMTPSPWPPTSTPTPSPTISEPPLILLAGYYDTNLLQSSAGLLTILALCSSPVDARIEHVEMLVGGQPAGVFLNDMGEGLFRLEIPIPGRLRPCLMGLELQAVDENGLVSKNWPMLGVE